MAIGLGGALIAVGEVLIWPAHLTIGGALVLSAPVLALGLLPASRLDDGKGA